MTDGSSAETYSVIPDQDKREPTNQYFARSEEVLSVIKKANYDSEWYRDHDEVRHQQSEVISRLPPDFLERIAKHLSKGREDAKRHGEMKKFNDFNYTIGEIFEILIEIEDENFDLFPDIDRYPQTDRDRQAGKILLDVMHNPTKYGLMQRAVANPDLVKLSLENGTFVVKDATEAKTHLDARSYRQLGRNGFRKSFQFIIDEINGLSDPSKFGLEDFASYGINIDIALDYIQKLVIPRDLKVDEDSIDRRGMSDHELNEFVALLQNSEDVVVGRSAFSKTELRNFTQWVLGEIYNQKLLIN